MTFCYTHHSGKAESPTEWPTAPQLDCGCGCPDGGSRTSPEKPGIVFKGIREEELNGRRFYNRAALTLKNTFFKGGKVTF